MQLVPEINNQNMTKTRTQWKTTTLKSRHIAAIFIGLTSTDDRNNELDNICHMITARSYALARTMPSHDVRPSVCRSHAVFYGNGKTYRHTFFHRRVATPLEFFSTKREGNIPTGTPLTGASNARRYEKSRFSTNISLYLGNDTRQSQSYYGKRI